MIQTLPDVTITGSAQALAAASKRCRWITVFAPSGNSADVRVGDSNVTTSRGRSVPKGTGMDFPPQADDPTGAYDLADIYVIGTSNDKLTVTFDA